MSRNISATSSAERAIARADGDVVLVGHSYGGAVIGQAGNDPKVTRLVYVDAFAPDAGESAFALFSQFQSAPLGAELRPDAEGFLKLSHAGVFDLFAQELSEDDKALVYATQGPVNGAALGGTLSEAAWRTRPIFYLVGDEDHAIPRAEQERMAARMNATVAHVSSSHVPMLSQPAAVARFILEAMA